MIQKDENGNIVCIQHAWHAGDVEARLEALGIDNFSDLQIEQVLMDLDQKFDASLGINWDIIDEAIIWVKNTMRQSFK